MDYLRQYIIPIKGIKNGIHHFDYDVDKKFFENTDSSEIDEADLKVEIELNKSTLLTSIKFFISGTVQVKCDRCLDNFDLPLSADYDLFIKFSDDENEDDEKVLFVPEQTHELSISKYIYEFIILSMPLQKAHPDDEKGKSTCNPKMLKILENYIIDEEKSDTDPRWDNLKKFKDK